MKTVEKLGIAFRGLLKASEESPVTVTYRGVNDRDEKSYEIKLRSGQVICSLSTEAEVARTLTAARPGEAA